MALLRKPKLPLRLVLVVPFVLQLLIVVGVLGWLSLRHGRQAVDGVTVKLRAELTSRISDYLEGFLAIPHEINAANATALALGELDPGDPVALARHFHHQLDRYEAVSFIFYGSRAGGSASAGRRPGGTRIVSATDLDPRLGLVPGNRYEYVAGDDGDRGGLLSVRPGFDARERPWYAAAVRARKPAWSAVYPLFADRTLAIAASRPVYSGGELRGVFGVDLRLTGIGTFLRGLDLGAAGRAFILDRSGLLVASSLPPADGDPTPRRAANSEAPLVRDTARLLEERFTDLRAIRGASQLEFDAGGEHYFVQTAPLEDPWGLDWLIAIVVPESEFTAPLEASKRQTILIFVAAFVLVTLLGLHTARRITRPIRRLNEASQAIAAGRLDERVEAVAVDELDELAHAWNAMAERLEGSFDELETRVAERTAELRHAKEAADHANRAKTRFLANVSHEIRTPLAAILGYVDLLLEGKLDAGEAELYLRTIRHQGRHLNRLLSDLLDLTRIEAERLELEIRPCELAEILADLRSAFEPGARDKGLRLEIRADAHLPWTFAADPTRLRQILSNLLSNAIKFTERGEVALEVGCAPPVADGETPREAVLRFVVTDTGVGIAEADRERLFQRFSQVERAGATRPAGFGLGLAITRELTELMGGSVECRGRRGGGSRFVVVVPVDDCGGWGRGEPPTAAPAGGGLLSQLERLEGTVLIAEDSKSLQTLCRRMLERWGLRCEVADHGRQAVDLARRHRFDVILMDWQMPVMDGLAATREIRRHGIRTPIVALTAAALYGDRERCLDAGCDRYLVKPIDFKELHRLLGKLLGTFAETGPMALPTPAQKAEQVASSPIAADDPELLALVRGYVRGLPATVEGLRAALADDDWRRFVALAHKLVGTAGTYGLGEIFRGAEALESAGESRDRQRAVPELERLAAAVERAVESVAEPST